MSTSGAQLLPMDAVLVFREQILPLATILTPNIPEAKLLLENAGQPASDPQSLEDLIEYARAIHRLKPQWVLLKGGHLPLTKDRKIATKHADRQIVIDILVGESHTTLIEADYLDTKNTHGTGCSLACMQSNILLIYYVAEKT